MGDFADFINMLKEPLQIDDLFDDIVEEDDEKFQVTPEQLASPWLKTFDELRTQMIKIDDFLYKRITKQGNMEKGLMPEISRVAIRNNAFSQGESKEGTTPFDSSFLRGKICSFYSGQGEVLAGIEKAVRTMYEGEEAQFVISYELLFGKMGCVPRIKPSADGLFVIELVSFKPVADIDAPKTD